MNEDDEMTQLNKFIGPDPSNDRGGGGIDSISTVEARSSATESIEGMDCSSQSGDRGTGQRIGGSGARTVGGSDL